MVQVAAPFLLIAAGEQEISSSLAGILVTSAPLFTALLAIWVDHEERSQGLRLVGVLLGFVGVAVLLGRRPRRLGRPAARRARGRARRARLRGRRLHGQAPARRRAADRRRRLGDGREHRAAAAGGGRSARRPRRPGLGPVAAVVALGVLGTGVAFAIFYDLIATVGPARTWIVTYLAPGFAVVYGALLLDETITRRDDRRPGADPRRLVARGRGPAAAHAGGPVDRRRRPSRAAGERRA